MAMVWSYGTVMLAPASPRSFPGLLPLLLVEHLSIADIALKGLNVVTQTFGTFIVYRRHDLHHADGARSLPITERGAVLLVLLETRFASGDSDQGWRMSLHIRFDPFWGGV
jgi:hypothetical protein